MRDRHRDLFLEKKHYNRHARPRPAKKKVGWGGLSTQRNARKKRDDREDYLKPRIDPGLKSVFSRIGIPEPEPLKPDHFQLEALALIKDYDVIVSAPTGSGKTWIASQTILTYLSEGLNVWYASPLKALSNSIYQEFCNEFGPQNCGILTGDRKENPDAPVIVGTTEILRNQLYDVMREGSDIRSDLVILDEAHYLSDPERGVVWEEVLIYLAPRVRLLLLSATVSNAEEVCLWLRKIRGTSNRVVRSTERPVPLEMLFLFPDGLMVPLGGKKRLNPKVRKFLNSGSGWRGGRRGKIDFNKTIRCLREFNLLPAIFFLKSRKDCDRAALTCAAVEKPREDRNRLKEDIEKFLKEYPHLMGHRQLRPLVESSVASHHGGQLPYWKVLIEKMMNKGHLEAIFSTSTVAAGVNFPARTVAIAQSDRFNGHEFADLTATELHQMIGRAGRRGKDHIGFALVIPGLHQDPQLIHELRDSPTEPILSQIHINFSMTLNLLLSHTSFEVKGLLARSFAAFQERESGAYLKSQWTAMLSDLKKILANGKCDTSDPYEVIENIEKRLELQRQVKALTRAGSYQRLVNVYQEYLKRGRLFLHRNGSIYAVFRNYTDQGRFICMACNIKKSLRSRNRRFRLRKVDLAQIKDIFDCRLDIPENYSADRLEGLFDGVLVQDLHKLDIDVSRQDIGTEKLNKVIDDLRSLPCEECRHRNTCHRAKKGDFQKLIRGFRSMYTRVDGMSDGLWLSFRRHVRFLKETGFVDDAERLTPDGFWASKLRLDQPLLIAEAIRKGAFDGLGPEILAGGLAPFVWDRTQKDEMKIKGNLDLKEVESMFNGLLDHIEPIRDLKEKLGFGSPEILFWPCAALYVWARGIPWDELLDLVPVEEGDMASLIMRTADHLRQIANLKETHPHFASVAYDAIECVLREPVYIA